MRKQTLNLKWHIAESDAEWERLQVLLLPDIPPAIRRRLQLKRYLWSAATILLLLAVTATWWRNSTQASLQAAEAALRTACSRNPWRWLRLAATDWPPLS